jgi:hypothetical protein
MSIFKSALKGGMLNKVERSELKKHDAIIMVATDELYWVGIVRTPMKKHIEFYEVRIYRNDLLIEYRKWISENKSRNKITLFKTDEFYRFESVEQMNAIILGEQM